MPTTREKYLVEIAATTAGAVRELKAWDDQVDQANTSFDKFSKKIGVSSASLKAGLAGMVSGFSVGTIATGLQQAADAYVAAAEGANLLSKATNASVEDASRFNAVASKMGLGMNDLVEIFADFQQAAGDGGKNLAALGVSLSKTAGGQTDWIATATEFLTQIQSIGDATERNRLLFKFFGEEGAKQLMALVSSGRSAAEAMAAVSEGQVIHDDDNRAVQDYKRSMADLNQTVKDLSISLGRDLVPALKGAADGLKVFAEVNDKLPFDFLTRAFPVLMLALKGIGKAFGDSADEVTAAATEYKQAADLPISAQQALNDMLAAGVTNMDAYRDAVTAAAEAEATQEANTRAAADAIAAKRAETDLAWEATLNLAAAEGAYGDAQRALVNGIDAVGEARARAREADARSVAGPSQDERNRVRAQIKDAEKDLKEARKRVRDAKKDVRDAFTVGELRNAKSALKSAQDAVDAAEKRRGEAVAHGPTAAERASARASAAQAREDAREAERRVLGLAQAQAEAYVKLKGSTKSLADQHDLYIESLEKSKKLANTTTEREAIQDLIDKLKEAQKVAGEGIKIGKVRYESGTSKKQVDTLKQTIRDAMAGALPWAMGSQAQAQIDSLKIPVSIGGVDQAKNDLITVTKGPDGEDRQAKVNVDLVGDAEAKETLDKLAEGRTVTLTYSVVPPTTPAYPPYTGLPRAGGQAMPSSLAVAGGGAGGAGVNYAPTIVNNYPKPERASDSIASSLRVARYLAGV